MNAVQPVSCGAIVREGGGFAERLRFPSMDAISAEAGEGIKALHRVFCAKRKTDLSRIHVLR
jgi:hypothetical protein